MPTDNSRYILRRPKHPKFSQKQRRHNPNISTRQNQQCLSPVTDGRQDADNLKSNWHNVSPFPLRGGAYLKKSSKGSVLLVIALIARWEQDVLPWSECGSKLDFSVPWSALGSIILIGHKGHIFNAAIDSPLPQPPLDAKRRSLGCLFAPKWRSVASPNPSLQFPLLWVHACSPCLGHLVGGIQCQYSEGYLRC